MNSRPIPILHYKKSGSGPPLLLLHGNGEDHHIFDKLTQKLSSQFTTYAIDSRNHGQSEKTSDFTYQAMSRDIIGFIKTLNLGKVNIIGFSDGAIISLLLAMQDQLSISRMALLGVNLKPSDFTEESYQYIVQTYEETHDPLFKMMMEQPNIELAELKHIHTPTLVIGAEHDIYKPELFQEIANTMPNASLKIMPGHDHASYIVDQDILARDLIIFFS